MIIICVKVVAEQSKKYESGQSIVTRDEAL
jgi:hypothetical protein